MKNSEQGYDNRIVRWFAIMSVFWGVVGFSVGVLIALQLVFPNLNFDLPWTTFGRLRPLHTSAVIFAFGGNVLMMSSFFIAQKTCGAVIKEKLLSGFVFFGYQAFIVIAALGYVMGVTQGKEYAEPEWYADILLTIVWVAYLYVYMSIIARRTTSHIYVANWFFLAFIIIIAILHLGNNLSIPISWTSTSSVSVFSGVQSAMIQWWYGHNAVGFFLTAGFLGIVYYIAPKRANKPVYSYRLSILHFWGLVFIYIWAGPHHLHYTSLPDWLQSLGMTMSLLLWIPSWGGMVNGMMTLSGAWHKLREDPVLKFLITSLAFYGMSTFEGPMMSIKTVNALSHYTEWTVGHVHSGALGWVAMISFASLYHIIPVVWQKKEMYSVNLMNWHFWISTIGIVLYITSMWTAGITQGLMWRSYDDMGFLKYSFVQTVVAMHPYYIIRAIGGIFFLLGSLIMVYNVIMTIKFHHKQIV